MYNVLPLSGGPAGLSGSRDCEHGKEGVWAARSSQSRHTPTRNTPSSSCTNRQSPPPRPTKTGGKRSSGRGFFFGSSLTSGGLSRAGAAEEKSRASVDTIGCSLREKLRCQEGRVWGMRWRGVDQDRIARSRAVGKMGKMSGHWKGVRPAQSL